MRARHSTAEIDREARAAKAILVCWSPTARELRWVIAEAMIGFEQDKLAACHVAGPDGFSPPTPFNTSHAEDLRAWLAAPSETHAGWRSVLRRIGKLCGRPDIESWGALDAQASAAELRAWIGAHEQSPLFMEVETVLRAREEQDAERARLEQEARARRAREEAERRAKEEAERLAREEREQVERKVREEAERRAQVEREVRARRETEERIAREEAESVREAEARRQAGSSPRLLWWAIAGCVVLVVGYLGVSNLGGSRNSNEAPPTPMQTPVEATTEPSSRGGDVSAGATGAAFRDCAVCPEMVVVPAGSFTMGSPESETDRFENESPVHRVSVQSFEASKYEVTFAQWDACVADGGCGGYQPPDEGWGRGNRPVINVSWNDAQEYVRWLSREARHNYRLLTEAEWEYAARAGTTTAYSTGASISASQARFSSQSTAAVGSFPANAFGLYDMHGNVWEWVEDCYADSYAGHQSDGSAYETNDCSSRVLRGGSWINDPQYLRSANRNGINPSNRNINSGFRVARTV